jgi:hypothetical protein
MRNGVIAAGAAADGKGRKARLQEQAVVDSTTGGPPGERLCLCPCAT